MNDPGIRLVLLSLDGMNHGSITPDVTSGLWQLVAHGGMAPEGGRCDVPAVTYVSHATLITGTFPTTHGVTSNLASAPRPGIVPGWAGEARVQVPTLFDALRDAGIPSAAVCGDQNLVRIMGFSAASSVWPAGGVLPDGTPVCPFGYALNEAVRGPLLAAAADRAHRFVFGHLNESDTWGHLLGPNHPQTLDSYRATDAIVGEVIDVLHPEWEQIVLIVLSDHGMEAVNGNGFVDLYDIRFLQDAIVEAVAEGGAAIVRLREGVSPATAGKMLRRVPGVAAWREMRQDVLVLEGEAGAHFVAGPAKGRRGVHGGPGTTVTLAMVAGGHPVVDLIASAIAARPPHLADWAPTIAALFGVPFPTAEGRNLVL